MADRGEQLSDAQLAQQKPVRSEGGKSARAFCPFHGSDKQRSLRVDLSTGRFQCFACGVWGYMDWAREQFRAGHSPAKRLAPKPPISLPPPVEPALDCLAERMAHYQLALPGSLGHQYLEDRRIPLELAQRFGVGYSPQGQWAHRTASGKPIRDCRWGRLVFPHHGPGGSLLNLYGRAVGDSVPKALRHDHLPGSKGFFNFPALQSQNPVYVCEGPFDALSLMAANPDLQAIAIFGVNGWRHDWVRNNREFVFALDADLGGQQGWRKLARELVLRGKSIRYLSPSAYGGCKDINEAWISGVLKI